VGYRRKFECDLASSPTEDGELSRAPGEEEEKKKSEERIGASYQAHAHVTGASSFKFVGFGPQAITGHSGT
jgi:hypothetical protein